jgi:TIGR03009 family protein
MRTIVAWTMTLAVAAGTSATALAQQPQGTQAAPKRAVANPAGRPAQPAAAPADPKAEKALQDAFIKAREEMNALLDEWEKYSKKITSLDVEFERIDKAQAWGDQYFKGRAMFKSPDLACLEFTKIKLDAQGKPIMVTAKDGKPSKAVEAEPTERIVCTGKEVLQYTWDDRKIFVFPLDKQVRQKSLQQGPLPFLFNMRAADARQRYGMRIFKQNENEYLISIVPNEEIDKQSFSKAFLALNKKTFQPNKLWLYPNANQEVQVFEFTGIQPNKAMDNTFFSPSTKIPGWKVIFNPGGNDNGKPAQGPGANAGPRVGQAQPARPAPQPAMRPGTRPR